MWTVAVKNCPSSLGFGRGDNSPEPHVTQLRVVFFLECNTNEMSFVTESCYLSPVKLCSSYSRIRAVVCQVSLPTDTVGLLKPSCLIVPIWIWTLDSNVRSLGCWATGVGHYAFNQVTISSRLSQ